MNVPFLGRLPIYQPIREGSDRGVPLVESEPASAAARAFLDGGRAHRGAGVDVGAPGRRSQPRQDPPDPGAMTRQAAPVIDLPYTKRTLDNGLDVIVHEDHHVPIVAVNLWYHVGSKNEQPGRTGFAHLFEHLMFEGSASTTNSGYFAPLQAAGGQLNGSTNADRTNYWEVVPTNAVDLALWMESDRMAYLLPALTKERFETQRDVVLNERRQNYENRPVRPGDDGHRGGALSARPSLQLDDDRVGRRHPGDGVRGRPGVLPHLLPPGQRLARAGRRHRHRPRRSSSPSATSATSRPASRRRRSRAAAALDGERRLVLEDRVELPRLYFGVADAGDVRARRRRARPVRPTCWPTARRRGCIGRSSTSAASPSTCPPRSSRARWRASSCWPSPRRPGASLTELAAAVDDEIAPARSRRPDDRRDGARRGAGRGPVRLPPADRRRVRRQVRSAQRLQRAARRSRATSRATSIATGWRRAESVRDAAQRYLRPDRRVVLSVVPRGRAADALPGSVPVAVS